MQTRDVATYGILKEIEAGRGSPHGGVYLSFEHCSEAALRDAFGPVIDRLAANRIDLTQMPVEVAPIAHYHMGGIVADDAMRTDLPRPVRGRRSGRRRQRRQPPVGQCRHRSTGVRPPRRTQRRRMLAEDGSRCRRSGEAGRRGARSGRCRPAPSVTTQHRGDDRGVAGGDGRRCRAAARRAPARSAPSRRSPTDGANSASVPAGDAERIRHAPARMVRSAQHAARRPHRRRGGACPQREPRRAPARGFSRHAARNGGATDSARRATARSIAAARMSHDGDAGDHGAAPPRRSRPRAGRASRCRSSRASRCSTGCAGYAAIAIRPWRCAIPASTPMPARNA